MWNWPERAQAWDRDQAQQVVEIERDERLAARRRRLEIVNEMLESVVQVLRKADLPELGRYEARAWLPVMRLMLKDLLVAQRVEYEHPDQDMGEQRAFDVFRADDFAHAMEQLALWSENLNAGPLHGEEAHSVILLESEDEAS